MNETEKIVALVEQMRRHAQDQEIHKNVPRAKEALALLEKLDDPEEGPLGKAYACNAILEQLSEYDTPRFTLEILRRELAWLRESEEESDGLPAEDVEADIARLEAYIDPDGLSMDAFCQEYGRHLRFDPVERTARWEDLYFEVEEECSRRLKGVPRGMGFCFPYWAAKRDVLRKYGIDWKSPHMMNPRVIFD